MSKLQLRLEDDQHVIVERYFNAPVEAVYRAHMDPELLRQWLLGPDGWHMTECINEAKVGGKLRYAWADEQGASFSLTGEVLELDAPHRVVHVERMHLPDPTPDNHIVTTFEAHGQGTRLTLRMTLPDKDTRAAMLATGMDQGMEASYHRLELQQGWEHLATA